MQVAGRGLRRYRPVQKAWDTVSFGNGVGLQCLGVNGDGLIGGFSLAQEKLTIADTEPHRGDTNRPATSERVLTFEEAARLRADPAMKRRIRGSAVGDSPYKADLRLLRFGEERWQTLAQDLSLPAPPNCLLVHGSDLWLGGPAYVAVFDLAQHKLRTVCTIPARSVDRIQIAGGYLWAQSDKHLHKASLAAVR
jgi:hypothetical protein